jgi:HD superfamily phosphohydrolase
MPCSSAELAFYRSLLSGVLDPDKLDYLNRDAWACGVPYGMQDVDFILQHLCVDEGARPGVDLRGVMSVEAVLFSKYQMYKAVYWHRMVRGATAMIKKAVISALQSGSVLPGDLYGLDDAGFYSLMAAPGRDESGLIRAVFTGQLLPIRYEAAFDPLNPRHALVADLAQRSSLEAALAAEMPGKGRKARFIIDLPEPISFESGMPVAGTGQTFTEASTAFGSGLVQAFERSLRIVRVFSDAEDTGVAARIAGFMAG